MRFILFFALLSAPVFAQTNLPDWGPVFPQNEVASIRITIDPDSLVALMEEENLGTDREFPASFIFQSNLYSDTVALVGIRARGNTSLGAQKKSFEISFNTFTENGNWNEFEKLNINGNHNDPSLIRAKLCWDAYREDHLPGARTGFVNLYINGENRGVYTNTEHIDEEFAKKYFDNYGDGNLFKCLYPAPLEYLGDNGDDYKEVLFGRRPYDLKTNEWADDYSDLAYFIKILNQTPISSLRCEIEKIFNADRYLEYAAIDVLTGNWDNYAYNQNNYYLYHNQRTGLFEYIPYDLDNTLGIDWVNQNWTTRNIYNWAPSSEQRPLFKRLLQVPEYRERFTWFIHHFSQTIVSAANISNSGQAHISLLESFALADPYRQLDYGFTNDDFLNSLTTNAGGHVEFSIVEFIQARIQSALSQADAADEVAGVYGVEINSDFPFNNSVLIRMMTDNQSEYNVNFMFGFDGNSWPFQIALMDDGLGADVISGDGIYSGNVTITENTQSVLYRFSIVTEGVPERIYPCSPATLYLQKAETGLFINELMSNNESVISDEENKFEDWIELWNGSNVPVSLDGKYLTDDPSNPNKWPLPAATLFPGEFIILWADSDEEDGQLHTSFSLAAGGEEIRIYENASGTFRLIDQVLFPELAADVSWGREMDGAANWIAFTAPTPDASNFITAVNLMETTELQIYPNPGNGLVYFGKMVRMIDVYDLTGRKIASYTNRSSVEMELSSGTYLLNLDGNFRKLLIR